ncbi:MAG: sulfurtransferase, partial [Rhizobiales bacterium]|nr:sulfurtransferase [Hyphomicrobiales bacterium]
MAIETVAASVLKHWLSDGDEIALVDVREAGLFADGHAFLAGSIPYSCFEMRIGAVAPNRHVRLVLCDDGSGIADLAARRAEVLGFTRIFVLEGGTPAWQAAGCTLYQGVNVPSKTFGELIEEERATPHISADQLKAMQAAGEDLVIVDGRTFSEFQRYAIPGGISCANGELALRIDDLAPDPATKIVVNCAGRTRSIIGAQTLIDLGVENPVVALENGTQGWV